MFKMAYMYGTLNGITELTFNGSESLTDFDIVIVDPDHVRSTFPKAEIGRDNRWFISDRNAHVAHDLIEHRTSEFRALADNGKIIVSFMSPLSEVVIGSQNMDRRTIDNYSWIPDGRIKAFTKTMRNGTGSGVQLVDKAHLFSPYYSAFQKELTFNAYIDVAPDSFKFGKPFILNSANRIIGFSTNISNGIMVFLPKYRQTEENDKKFVGILLQIAKKYFGSEVKSSPPDWTNTFTIPGVNILNEKIDDIEREISEINARKSEIEGERDSLNEYKFLLYEQGHVLERKVIDALRLIGFKADTVLGQNTDFDVILESGEGRAIAEVEGKDDNPVHKDKIDQLLSAINQDAEEKGVFVKGVLVGNHYRLKPIDQREEPFTKTVVNLAKQYHYALITTVDLYNVAVYILEHPEDEDIKNTCRKAIFEANGEVVKFPIPDVSRDNNENDAAS